ncbi:MAG: hypothetical protein ABI421_02145 [Polyangiaceae bacterium]
MSRRGIPGRDASLVARCSVLAVFLLGTSACREDAKVSAQKAADQAAWAEKQNENDVTKISAGLAAGAKQFAPLYANGGDPRVDPQEVRATLFRARKNVPELNAAKTTFSVLIDAQGVGIRNDLEQDSMAGANLFTAFPSLKNPKGLFTTASGVLKNDSPSAQNDKTWVGEVPVAKSDGSVGGYYLTGYTFRQYAFQLQDALKQKMNDDLAKRNDHSKLPVFYLMLFDASGAYGPPMTPEVNETQVKDLDLVSKTATAPAQGVVNISDRDFGYAATRLPSFGADIGVVVLRSEI